jgi:hypothetical protein
VKAEYYEVEEKSEKLLVFTQILTEDEERWWEDELDSAEKAELKARGWRMEAQQRQRQRVRKYTMSGAEVLKDHGLIAGPNIPIVPVYGKRWYVDNQERFRGHVSKLMDAQRIYNAKVSKLSETDSLYLDNMRQSVQREGEIYLGMAPECYFEAGRTVETMTEDGDDGEATLHESYTDKQGVHRVRNDFSSGRYKVIADVTEATATRRDKTVKQMFGLAELFVKANDAEGAKAAIITASLNMDGEGLTDFQKWNRDRAVVMKLVEPNEEEKAEAAKAEQQPDPTQELVAAEAALKAAQAKKAEADAMQSMAGAGLKVAQAHALGGPEEAPAVPDGLEAAHKVADIDKKVAEAEHIRTNTAHRGEELRIEAHNAETNRLKAMIDRTKSLFKRS